MMNSLRSSERGFATILAVSILALLGVLSLGLVRLTGLQIDRTRELARQLQVEQLLTAGAVVAPGVVAGWRSEDRDRTWAIDMPPELEVCEAAVSVWVEQTIVDIERIAHVQVLLEGKTARQSLRYVRDAAGWVLVEARLGELESSGIGGT